MTSSAPVLLLALAVGPALVDASGFLKPLDDSARRLDAGEFDRSLQTAMGEAMGCGGQIPQEQLDAISGVLTPMWRTLPKNGNGRVERRSLRYLAHRYFNQQSSLWIRGFEPTRPVNHTAWGSDDILSQRVPAFVESVLESQHAQERGFNLQDAVLMVATLEQLIFDAESSLLETVYRHQQKRTSRSFGMSGVRQVLEEYMLRWMMGDDTESVRILLANQTLLGEHVPHWDKVLGLVHGEVKTLNFKRSRGAAKPSRPRHNALSQQYSFEDAHRIVGTITRSFASFWESECADMKASLVSMDPLGIGRVPLAKFYSTALETEWRFGESEAYLRDLGALDETSWRGKQVIIPNYIQGASNCIVSSTHYMVCCVNECESMLGEIERAVAAPMALVAELLPLVGNMTSQTTVDHDDPPRLEGPLEAQLEQIAALHGGKVPLHGRLFAQWLHYAFPRECAFPHMTGTATLAPPAQYGDHYTATEEEMRQHARRLDSSLEAVASKEEMQWMSQWSEEEELIASYDDLQAPWWLSRQSLLVASGAALLLFGLLGVLTFSRGNAAVQGSVVFGADGKSHFV